LFQLKHLKNKGMWFMFQAIFAEPSGVDISI